jgi:hypothetical protein
MTTEKKTNVRDLPPTAVRLPPEVRHALAREAAINGRTLHGEIVQRLRNSVAHEGGTGKHGAAEGAPAYAEPLSDGERALLAIFRKMSPEKQLALLSLFK